MSVETKAHEKNPPPTDDQLKAELSHANTLREKFLRGVKEQEERISAIKVELGVK